MDVILIALIASLCLLIAMIANLYNHRNKDKKIYTAFILLGITFVIHLSGLILQRIFINSEINPIYFDYITYIGGSFTPLVFLAISKIYQNNNINLEKYKILLAIPIFFILAVLTNDLHHLFYIKYDINYANTVFGPLLYMFAIYSYSAYVISMIVLSRKSIKNSGIFSIQTALIVFGMLIPLIGNFLGIVNVIDSNIYLSPILLIITSICFYIAIIRLKALNVIPVTLKAIVDNMSDAFVVISEDGTIADLNKTFIEKFKTFGEIKNNDNLFDILKSVDFISLDQVKADIEEAREKETTITKEYHIEKNSFERYFEVDFQPVKSKDGSEYVATLVLLRDVTQAKKDMEVMLKNESLVMLGELAGGVAHDINTPISAIKSGLLIFKTIAKSDDEKMLVERMDSCANKIVTLTNSLRNQIRNIGSNEVSDVNITAVIKDVSVIIHNELTKHKVNLNLDIKKDLIVKGNSAKLSQVLTNIIVNAIQAYEDKGGTVNVVIDKIDNAAVISIEDFAGGIPEHIRDNIGKNILTTKGVSGTGFGLYLAYSVITGAFGGEITFDSITGKGTTFYIRIPMN